MIHDIDGDDDLEIIAGTSLSLNVIDIKQSGSQSGYWSMYKGNYQRTGYNEFESLCQEGDLNEDGTIDILDILQEINIILGVIEPSLAQICASDMNTDGAIDLLDIILLVSMVLDQ